MIEAFLEGFIMGFKILGPALGFCTALFLIFILVAIPIGFLMWLFEDLT